VFFNVGHQMSVESLRHEFIRLHEYPFSSDNKYMAVKVTPKRSQVGDKIEWSSKLNDDSYTVCKIVVS
jgi:magnesium-transporting ATPase (P-type)